MREDERGEGGGGADACTIGPTALARKLFAFLCGVVGTRGNMKGRGKLGGLAGAHKAHAQRRKGMGAGGGIGGVVP